MAHGIVSTRSAPAGATHERAAKATRTLLLGGAIAGPLYLAVGLVEAFTRPGFDIRRHDLSLLANGDLGWIHVLDLIVSGLLVVGAAVAMRRVLTDGRGRTWVPILVAVYGLGVVGGGLFSADPAFGFPPGTPADAHAISWHGLLHIVSGAVGFFSLIAACFIYARRQAAAGERGRAAYSVVVGVVFLLSFFGIAAGSGNGWTILGFWIGVVLAWSWVTTTSLRLAASEARS